MATKKGTGTPTPVPSTPGIGNLGDDPGAYVIPDPVPVPVETPVYNPPVPDPEIINTAAEPVSNQLTLKGGKPGQPEPYAFGRCIVDGIMVAADDSGDDLFMDVLWSVGEIDYLEGLYYDNSPEGRRDAFGVEEHFVGTAGQAASTIMTGLKGSYDALPNKAHSVVIAVAGLGLDIKALGRWIKCRDPRNSPDTPIYSTNPALALARILEDSGYTVNDASLVSAANYCDEITGSPGDKRWEIGGQIKRRKSLRDWIHTMATYASCYVDLVADEVFLTADEPRAANHTITADDMIDGSVRVSRPGGRSVPDAVTVTGRTVDGDQISYTFGTSGGAGTETTLNLPFFQTGHCIGRKAEETYNKARNNLTLQFDGFDAGLERTIGDVGTITNAQFGLSSQTFTLIERQQIGRGRWRFKYYEYNAANYSDVHYIVTPNDSGLDNPNQPPAGPTPTATEQLVTLGGVTQSRFKITFTGISWAYLDKYLVTVTGGGETIGSGFVEDLGVTTHTFYTTGTVVSGVLYTVKVFVISNTGKAGNPGTTTITSSLGTSALLNEGDLTNMHIYILDGTGRFCTTSEKTGSPQTGETWANRFSSSPLGAWAAGETWLGDQVCETTFETEVWDSGNLWSGGWQFSDIDISELNSATRGNFVALSGETSPISFTDYSGTLKSGEARYMKAKCTVVGSPIGAGEGLHVKLPIPVHFTLGT